jgi:hypothetical protein
VVAPKREHSVHVRICDEADAVLELLAQVGSSDKSVVAADLLHRALLGEGHAVKVAAMRFARMGITGTARE